MTDSTAAPIDWQEMLRITNNKSSLAKDMLLMFTSELPRMQSQIRTAFQDNDVKQLQHFVHRLHGSCCYCAAPQLKKLACEFEDQLKQDNTDNIAHYISQIEAQIKVVLQFVNEQLVN